mmetsp:Transcript_19099/g.41184  ORF Transcript_19099/g.41184 Transcript_19099/m.41184 type:complete len:218 (-) Transcript_19099:1096-1749(-)
MITNLHPPRHEYTILRLSLHESGQLCPDCLHPSLVLIVLSLQALQLRPRRSHRLCSPLPRPLARGWPPSRPRAGPAGPCCCGCRCRCIRAGGGFGGFRLGNILGEHQGLLSRTGLLGLWSSGLGSRLHLLLGVVLTYLRCQLLDALLLLTLGLQLLSLQVRTQPAQFPVPLARLLDVVLLVLKILDVIRLVIHGAGLAAVRQTFWRLSPRGAPRGAP